MNDLKINAAIAAMAAIINNKEMMEECERIASNDKVSIASVVASQACDFAEALEREYRER